MRAHEQAETDQKCAQRPSCRGNSRQVMADTVIGYAISMSWSSRALNGARGSLNRCPHAPAVNVQRRRPQPQAVRNR
jgi:hypothetical protein